MRVLIAEDDRTTARLLAGLIESWGYDVVPAYDGKAALIHFEAEAEATPQLVLLDWMLPGMDGPEVCRRIRELRGNSAIYIILLTSKSARTDVVAGLEAGADEYLVKPFDAEELRARLKAGARII